MALHEPWDRHFVTNQGVVRTAGHSITLGKGELGIFDVSPENQTKNGNPAVSNFSNQPKDRKFEIKLGRYDALSRSGSNKSMASIPFRVQDVVSLAVSAPKDKSNKVDDFIVGFDGRDGTEFSFLPGETTEISVKLHGEAMGYLGYNQSEVLLKAYLRAPEVQADINNEEIVMEAIMQLKGMELLGQVDINDYVDILPVKDTGLATPANATAYNFYELTVQDLGDSSALGLVQAQYPNYVVKRTERIGLSSTYTIIAPSGEIVTGGSFVVDQEYEIVTAGTTDFTLIGAADNNVGTRFVATGVGAGTGTAQVVVAANYVQGIASIIKDCDACPAGFVEEGGGVIYNITLEDDGADSTATVQAVPGAKATTASKEGQENGVGIYVVVTDDELTQAEIDAFVTANPTATVNKVGETVAICTNGTVSTTAWVSTGDCNATIETYQIRLADTECGDSRLAEVQAAYPDLTITEVGASNTYCQRTYETTVATNVVCEECDPAFRDIFESEAPSPFDMVEWEKDAPVYDATAKMGIRIRAKESLLGSNGEALRYDMPFLNTSVRLEVAAGHPTNVNENFAGYSQGVVNVKLLSRAEERSNLGGDLMDWDTRSKHYFTGNKVHTDSLYARTVLGEESDLDEFTQYVDYALEVNRVKFSQGFNGTQSETFVYHILAPVGKHDGVEALLNSLAGAANVEVVKAYGE